MEESTLRDIAAKAGASPASVIVHFKNKTALLEEALVDDIDRSFSALVGSMPEGAGFLARVMHLWTGMLWAYDRNRNLYRALISHTIFQPAGETPGMSKQSDECIRLLSTMIEEQKAAGVLHPDTDPFVASASLFSL
ncbi:MAG: TetR/AcrR family transcriptional regulator [Chitinivibrionia bacterium]|nr:TetR/AcrR family transcriptional regulator [Chitinivibrionia bacterium]